MFICGGDLAGTSPSLGGIGYAFYFPPDGLFKWAVAMHDVVVPVVWRSFKPREVPTQLIAAELVRKARIACASRSATDQALRDGDAVAVGDVR